MAGKGLERGSAGTEIVKNFVVRSELLAEPQERQAHLPAVLNFLSER